MGRRKIEIQPITHERNRSVTFLKRKNGLFKKAYELGVLCSVDVAVIIFEERAGHHVKLHEYCSTDVDNMVQRHLHFDGEKEFKGPPDFNNKADTGDNDDEDEDDEEGGKRRVVGTSSASKMSTGMKTGGGGSGRMLQGKQSGSMMGLDMDYRGSMALPQPPLGHLQIPSTVPLSNPSPTSYQSSGIPVSLVRNTPNDGMPSAAKRQRLDSSASSGGYGGDNPYALHGDVQSPASYGLSSGLFPPSGQRQGGGGNPASPTTHQFFPQSMAGFPRTGSGGGNSRNSFSGGGSGSYQGNQPPIYNPSNPFASLIGSASNAAPGSTSSASPHGHGHSHAQHPGASFEPLDWPVHNPSSSGQQQSASQQPTSSDRGGPSSASPHPQSQSQQGFPPRPGQTASGGAGAQDTSWLDFLSNSAPPPGVAAGAGAGTGADTSRPGSVTSGGAGRRMEDSYERGMSGLSSSQIQRSRSDSSVKEEGGAAARAASVNSASDASRPSANGSALAGGGDTKEGLDIKSDKD